MKKISKITNKFILLIIILLGFPTYTFTHDNNNEFELNADNHITNNRDGSSSNFFKGADIWVNTQIKKNFSGDACYLLPSQRFLDMERVKNLRFMGMYGPRKSDLYVHPQILISELAGQYPQDVISLVIQCLFPSPDGVNLIANQAYSDPLSKISISNLGLLLRDLIVYELTGNKTAEIKEQLIVNLICRILPNSRSEKEIIQKYNELKNKIPEFLHHSFKLNFISKFYNFVMDDPDELDYLSVLTGKENIFDELSWLNSDITPYGLEKILGDTQLKSGELDHYLEFSHMYPKIKRNRNDVDTRKYKEQIFYEENSQFYQVMIFAKALIDALDLQEVSNSSLPYPQHIVERSLTAFMWLKSSGVEDIAAFYSSLFGTEQKEAEAAFFSHYTREAYEEIKGKLLADPFLFQNNIINNPTVLMLIGRGFEIYDSSFSPLLQYRSVAYQPNRKTKLGGTRFPDCVETSIRNFLNIIARTSTDEGYIYDGSLLKASKEVAGFYDKYRDVLPVFSSDAFTEWGNLLTELPDVVYCKPTNTNKRLFEVRTGVLNALKVISHLLNLQDLSKTVDKARSNDDEALNESNRILTKYLSRKGYEISVKDEDDLEWDDKREDYFGTLIFQVNGQDYFKWVQEKGHAYIKYFSTQQDDWRKNFEIRPVDFHHPATLSLLPWFINLQDLHSIKELSVEKQLALFWSLNLDDVDLKLNLIKLNIADPDPQLRGFSYQLVSSFEELDDNYATTQLAQLVYNMSNAENGLLKDDIIRIVSLLPSIMDTSVDITLSLSSPPSLYPFILWAYEISDGEALKAAYDSIEQCKLNFDGLPEEKLEIAYKVLKEIKNLRNLENLHVVHLSEQDDSGRKMLVEAMQHLSEEIEFINVSCNNLSYEDLLTILETAPTKFLEYFDISFNGIRTTEEAYKLCSTFLARFEKASLRMILEVGQQQGRKVGDWEGDLSELQGNLQGQGLDIDRLILIQ